MWGVGGGASHGLNDSKDRAWLGDWDPDLIYDPDTANVTRWLPEIDGVEVSERKRDGDSDYTDVYNSNGSYPTTRLWPVDPFWAPACARMAMELQRLQSQPRAKATGNQTLQVALKHYGATLPDENNHNATVWTYIHAFVVSAGSNVLPTFNSGCPQWLGKVAKDATKPPERQQNQSKIDWIYHGIPVLDTHNRSIQLTPPVIRVTAGGIKAFTADDGSVFSLWIVPRYQF